MSRQLEYMKQAHTDVLGVKETVSDENVWKAYGAFCHQVPMLVLTNGLALTAAFIDDKASGNGVKAEPFKLVRRHLTGVLDAHTNQSSLTSLLRERGRHPDQYMLDTFTVLDAWIFYKRFAESILDVKPGAGAPELETLEHQESM